MCSACQSQKLGQVENTEVQKLKFQGNSNYYCSITSWTTCKNINEEL